MKTEAQDQSVRSRCEDLPENIADCIRRHARTRPHAPALVEQPARW